MKFQRRFYLFVNTVIRVLLVLIVSGLLLQSLFSTSFIGMILSEEGVPMERTRNIADDPWRHLVVFAVFTVLGLLSCRIAQRLESRKAERALVPGPVEETASDNGSPARSARNRRIFRILSLITLAFWTLWILITQLEPGSDPAKVYGIAMQWREGNFSAYAEGGYLFRYPYQAGIILFYYLLSFAFGVDNYIGLQFVNVIALVMIYVLLSKLAAFFWKKDEKLPVLVYVGLLLWMPLAFYVTYLYGILPGMALSVGTVYCVTKYLNTGKYRYMLPACLCMGLATVIKMNCLIFLIAAACFLVYDAVSSVLSGRGDSVVVREGQAASGYTGGRIRRALASLLFIVLMSVSVSVCNGAVNRYVERLTGYEAGEGLEMLSWVVMGLQETPLGPGGYSGYIGDIYVRYDYDAEKVKEASWTDIKKALTRMSENPLDEGATFFARKNAFQWNDPSFIGLDRTKGRRSAMDMPAFVTSLIEGRGSVAFYVVMNYAQTLLLFGMLLYVFLNWRSRNLYELMGAVVFLGGYLFHFVWESSASYTIPYFVVMIPYGVKGLADWIRYVKRLPAYMAQNRRGAVGKKELVRKLGVPVGGTVVAVVLVVLLSRTNLFYKTFALDDGEEARAQFYQEEGKQSVGAADGYYYLTPYSMQDRVAVEDNGKVTTMSVKEAAGTEDESALAEADALEESAVTAEAGPIFLHHVPGRKLSQSGNAASAGVTLRFRSNEQVLAMELAAAPEAEQTSQPERSSESEAASEQSPEAEQDSEQLEEAEQDKSAARLITYMDDGMNMFYEEKKNVSYLWNLYGTTKEGYYIVAGDLALTCREGAVTLEKWTECEEQRWLLR